METYHKQHIPNDKLTNQPSQFTMAEENDESLSDCKKKREQRRRQRKAASAMSEAVSGYEMKRSQEIVTLLREEIATLREDLMLTMRSRLMVAGSKRSVLYVKSSVIPLGSSKTRASRSNRGTGGGRE